MQRGALLTRAVVARLYLVVLNIDTHKCWARDYYNNYAQFWYIQLQSGAKIQVTRDHEAEPGALTRQVELSGKLERISKAEQLIKEVLAEADAGSSGAGSGGRKYNATQPGAETFQAVIPLHLPAGDTSTERTVHIDGTQEQIEAAKQLISEVTSEKEPLILSGELDVDLDDFSLEKYLSAKTLASSRSFQIDSYHGSGMVSLADLYEAEWVILLQEEEGVILLEVEEDEVVKTSSQLQVPC
uniref:Uncharacterized protein n=1 Tax=Zea mays TaxID=4577 RepID=A0A804QNB4_MAIZE